jgi:hypothetical protein
LLFNKIREKEGGTGSAQKWMAQTMYTHANKCKNDKTKGKKKEVLYNL